MKFILNSREVVNNVINRLLNVDISADKPLLCVEVSKCTNNRSLAQNRLYWLYMSQISKGYDLSHGKQHSPETWSEYFKHQFLDSKIIEVRGEVIKQTKTTTKLNTKEFTDYLERIDIYCADELGVMLHHPIEYQLAMGVKE